MSDIHYVYRHYDADDILLYVGCTANLPRRTEQHRMSSKWFKRVARITKRTFPSKMSALKHECKLIATLSPKFNRTQHPYYKQRLQRIFELCEKGYSKNKIGKMYGVTGSAICCAVAIAEKRRRGILHMEYRNGR